MKEVLHDQRQIFVARFFDWLAAVHRLEDGEFAGALLNAARNAEKNLRAFRRLRLRPLRKRLVRRSDRARDVFPARIRDLCDRFFSRWIDRLEVLSGLRLDERASDEEPVRGFERGSHAFRRGGVGKG